MNPEDNKQSPDPQNAPRQTPQAQPSAEGPVVQDVVAPTGQSEQPPAHPVVKQPPAEAEGKPEPTNSNDAEQEAPESAEAKTDATVSLGGESEPLAIDDDGKQDIQDEAKKLAKAKKPSKQKQPSHLPIGFIIATVVVALVLMGLVVMMYMNQEAEAPEAPGSAVPISEPVNDNDTPSNDVAPVEETTTPDSADEVTNGFGDENLPENEEENNTSTNEEDVITE